MRWPSSRAARRKLTITGKAPDVIVCWTHHLAPREVGDLDARDTHVGNPDRDTHVGTDSRSRYELVTLATEAKQALVTLKFPKQIARDAVNAALQRLGPRTTLQELIREALRSLRATS